MTAQIDNDTPPTQRRISAHAAPYLYDQRAAVTLLRARRWKHGLYCPRCGSLDVREVDTTRVLEAFACRECRYNFTTVANTIFHASLLPLFMKLQMITVFELEPEISASRLSRVFKTKVKTAGRLLATLRPLPRNSFVSANNEYSPFESFPSLADYLEQRGIDFIPELFEERIDQLIEPAGRPMRRPSFVTPTVD